MGLRPVGGTPAEMAATLARDLPLWSGIIKSARITLE
jgi:hypothetical protein